MFSTRTRDWYVSVGQSWQAAPSWYVPAAHGTHCPCEVPLQPVRTWPAGHAAHCRHWPASVPPQPERYWPATQSWQVVHCRALGEAEYVLTGHSTH